MTVPELMKIIEGDRNFYERTGGGVTVSGGEVLVQWDFVRLLLAECRRAGIHTCVESALFVPAEHVDAVMEYTDLLITDIKFIDSARHQEVTKAPNELILSNMKRIAGTGVPMVIRTPIVPGWNDDDENMLGIGTVEGATSYYLASYGPLLLISALLSLPILHNADRRLQRRYIWYEWVRVLALLALLFVSTTAMVSDTYTTFLYANF